LERPLFLFRPPIPILVTAVVPDGPPARFSCDGGTQNITRHFGPERIETGWWRKRGVRRDYYRVETETGSRFWLFRSLGDGRWYLHGEFS
jgi:protein ImuB